VGYKIGEVLISESELKSKVKELGEQIRRDYSGRELVVVGVLKGAVVFLADLIREIGPEVNVKLDFLAISSYGASTKTSGVVQIQKDLGTDLQDKDVLIVEDILDTGLSLSYLTKLLSERHPKSLAVCVLLDKPERRKQHVDVQYTGFEIPDKFVIGYGLDVDGMYRHLSNVCVAAPTED
jgi:hypoxanthine phosphoribosyltransferase